jgi:myo-inositol-1(or 4)-monophosphatase
MVEEFVSIIKEAGEILKKGYYSKKEVQFKGKKDLLTKYDIAVEEFLKSRFTKFDYNIIAEESNRDSFGNSIIIDPIDGTTNFVNNLPFVAISVGVFRDKKEQFGIVYNPILDELFLAEVGKGAFLNGERIEVSKEQSFERALISTGFPYSGATNRDDLNWVIERLERILPRCQDIRRYGSASLDLCYTAKGSYDGFYEINLNPWDVSAGAIILKEAGGRVSNHLGGEFDMFNDSCIVATNGYIHQTLLDYLK